MKKLLLSGTALAAAGLAAGVAAPAQAQIELGLGGYMQQFVGYANSDTDYGSNDDAFSGFDVKSNTEIWFAGTATLDNGLQFGVNVQLEGNSNASDQIDESFLFVEGSFGRFNIGSENSAGYLMTYAAPNVGLGVSSSSNLTGFLPNAAANGAGAGFFRAPLGTTYVELDRTNDSEKITYFTPRFSGFQFGASYIPEPGQDNYQQVDEETVSFRDGFSLGANFVESFGGFDIAVSGRYDWADDKATGSDPQVWSAGINLGFAGFTVGGSYADADDMDANSGRGFDVGASYETGPWGVSVTYFNGKADGPGTVTAPDDAEYQAYEGAVAYALGPGITTFGSVAFQDLEASDGNETETWSVVGGFKLRF